VLADLEELAAGLHRLGMTGEEGQVREAMAAARREPDKAAGLLREVSERLLARVPAYSHGTRAVR
jgi:hypothetical protein